MLSGAARAVVDGCTAKPTFYEAWRCIEGQPHGAGHGSVGGIMVNVQLSPGDPLFWLHHAWIDRLWWTWQKRNLDARVSEISGPNLPFQFTGNTKDLGDLITGMPMGCPGGFAPRPGAGNIPIPNGTNPANVTIPSLNNGTRNGTSPFGAFAPKENKAITAYWGDEGSQVTLKHVLWSVGIMPNSTAAEMMDNRAPNLCVEYE
jgi:tyrosinase